MCVWLRTHLPRIILITKGRSSLVELKKYLDDRVTLSDKELHAVAYGSDTENRGTKPTESGKR